MTRDNGRSFTLPKGKDILQFAPNFSVYVLPNAVCLYSEDRKFFLHGELYGALASAIGKAGKSVRELVSELEKDFPSDKVEEALRRLLERRYVVVAGRAGGGAAAAACRRRPRRQASRNVVCASIRSMCRGQRSLTLP